MPVVSSPACAPPGGSARHPLLFALQRPLEQRKRRGFVAARARRLVRHPGHEANPGGLALSDAPGQARSPPACARWPRRRTHWRREAQAAQPVTAGAG